MIKIFLVEIWSKQECRESMHAKKITHNMHVISVRQKSRRQKSRSKALETTRWNGNIQRPTCDLQAHKITKKQH